MIEISLLNYMKTELENAHIYMEQPENVPNEYILLRLMDGGRINMVDAATFSIVVRSDRLYNAALLRDQVKEVILDAPNNIDSITSARLGGEIATTDSANHVYQYELIINFYYYKEETDNA